MQLAVNGRFLSRRVTGVERYGREILRCLEPKARVISYPHLQARMAGHLWEQFILPIKIPLSELLWSPANTGPLAVSNQVLTLHDLTALEHPEWFAPAFALWYRLLIPWLARRVKRIMTPAETVRQKILKRFSLPAGQVSVVPGGVDTSRFHPGAARPGGLPEKYIAFVGSLQPRKNLRVLLQAWEEVQPRHPDTWLVLAGGTESVFRPRNYIHQARNVHWAGYVAENDLPGLYASAQVFILPSLDEGFGLPALEAMASGTAVITASAGALPEVTAGAAMLFDPQDPVGLGLLIHQLLENPSQRREWADRGSQRAQALRWENSASMLWEVVESCR